MIGFYVYVPGKSVEELAQIVRDDMMSPAQIVAAARENGIPEACPTCESTLALYAAKYATIPSADQTIFFEEIEGQACCTQHASRTGCCQEVIKRPLRLIVQEHIVTQLQMRNIECVPRVA